MLNLNVVRGPLETQQQEQVLYEFNRLTSSQIALNEFRRWIQAGPEGPAYHALLTTDTSRVVGHICLIALRSAWRGQPVVPARAEYFFVHEDFRNEKVRGFESSFFSPAILLLDHLYRHCRSHGWGPFLISAGEQVQPFHQIVGCHLVTFPLKECLFVLRPWQAPRSTPNLKTVQRTALFGLSLVQSSAWAAKRMLGFARRSISCTPVTRSSSPHNGSIGFFEDEESRAWRYPDGEYVQFASGAESGSYLIAKNGSHERYLRVCDWHLSTDLLPAFVDSLLFKAHAEKMLGVRWAVYENQGPATELLMALRKLGFACASRTRSLLLYSDAPEFLDPGAWRISDSMFTFDL